MHSVVNAGASESLAYDVIVNGGWEEAQGTTNYSSILNGSTEQIFGGVTCHTIVGSVVLSRCSMARCLAVRFASTYSRHIRRMELWRSRPERWLRNVRSGDQAGGIAEFSTIFSGGTLTVYAEAVSEYSSIFGFEESNLEGHRAGRRCFDH